ncbi:MAG TPA: LytTR family DNA-binding domain-containing protein [Chryseolinea sp.]|nr:LytTR family DNA-binding domain-containing protein [Chryseolinea sp.]
MRIIIIEDELLAQANLEHLLTRVAPAVVVEAKLGSVKETLAWLAAHPSPDLAFVDIQLSDDHSFEIFRQIAPTFPIVFTTAYDKYVLESFEYNSIDYLLKPITEEKLRRTLEKVDRLSHHFNRQQLSQPSHLSSSLAHALADRIVARRGNQYVVVPIDEVAYLFTMHKIVFLKDFSGKQMIVDKNLTALESTLDPTRFIRLNRKYLAAARAIRQYAPVQGKIRVRLEPETGEEVYVSKESAPAFRSWIGQRAHTG